MKYKHSNYVFKCMLHFSNVKQCSCIEVWIIATINIFLPFIVLIFCKHEQKYKQLSVWNLWKTCFKWSFAFEGYRNQIFISHVVIPRIYVCKINLNFRIYGFIPICVTSTLLFLAFMFATQVKILVSRVLYLAM